MSFSDTCLIEFSSQEEPKGFFYHISHMFCVDINVIFPNNNQILWLKNILGL